MSRFRVIAAACAVALAGAVVLLLALGGGDHANLVSGEPLAQAAATTQRMAGASVSVEAKVEVGLFSKPLLIHLRGIQSTRQRAGYLAGSYDNLPKRVPGQNADGTIPVEIVTVIPDVYLRSPILGAAVPAGKWLHIDVARTGRQLGIGDPTQFGSGDPDQSLQALRALNSHVEQLGTEEVRGVPTTHYRATVELRRLPDAVPPARRAAAKQSSERLIQLIGTDSYPVETWVDSHHLVRRMRLRMRMRIQGRFITQDMTIELYDFGPKRRIKPPLAGDTIDSSQLSGPGAGP